MVFGPIPGGTSNGLVKSILDQFGENYGVQEAAYLIARGRKMKMDLMEIEGEYEEKKIFCFLMIAWAVIADIDINSEVFRCCGDSRYTVYGVYRALNT